MEKQKSYFLVPKLFSKFPVTYYFLMICIILSCLNIFLPVHRWLAISGNSIAHGEYYLFFTHIVGHRDFTHLFGNLLYLIVLMPFLESKLKPKNMFMVILIGTVLEGVLLIVFNKPNVGTVGASGLVYIFFGMYIILAKYMMDKIYFILLSIFVGISLAPPVIAKFVGLFSETLAGTIANPDISVVGHLSGLGIGLVLGLLYLPKLRNKSRT